MENLDQLQSIYNSQTKKATTLDSDRLLKSAKANIRKLQIGQLTTTVIISVTVMILFYFFLSVIAYQDWKLTSGLALMSCSLLVRTLLELKSMVTLNGIHPYLSTHIYLSKTKVFYTSRIQIQRLFTPPIYFIYGVGMTLFLLALYPSSSTFLFVYCLVTGVGFFFGFIWVIRYSYRKERELLKKLSEMVDKD